MEENFEIMRNKEIIGILDGDKVFGEYIVRVDEYDNDKNVKIKMPYLTGPDICNISQIFGLPQVYSGGKSRWQYFDELLAYCIEEEKISNFLTYLFAKDKFMDQLKGLPPEKIEEVHNKIVQEIIKQINSLLCFGDNELCIIGENYVIKPVGASLKINIPSVKTIDREYIRKLSDRATQDIENGDYDSAITKARTVLEETFCYVIEKRGEEPSTSGEINKLYAHVKSLYNMHIDKDTDIRVKTLLSGLEKIVSAIGQMRNKESDSHGVGSKRMGISDYHARLFVNAAILMADFILSMYLNKIE